MSKIRNKELGLRTWSWRGKKRTQFHKLVNGRFFRGNFVYSHIKTELEKIIPYKVTDSSTIIIHYFFQNDLCSSVHKDNKWTAEEISRRKKFLDPIKKDLNSKGVFFVCLFEKGLKVSNRSKSKKEYFFLDKTNFFRKNLFTTPTSCGSHAAIKPNGQTLIENGEQRADYFASYLKNEIWQLFFSN